MHTRLTLLFCLITSLCLAQNKNIGKSGKNLLILINEKENELNPKDSLLEITDKVFHNKNKEHTLDQIWNHLKKNKAHNPLWNFEINSFYASGSSASYFGNSLYSNIGLERRLQIQELPFVLKGDLIIQNNQVDLRQSAISIEFDQDSYLNALRERIEAKTLQKYFNDLPEDQQKTLTEYVKVETIREDMLSDAYKGQKRILIQQIDTMERETIQKIDSVKLDSLYRLLEKADRIERRIDSVYNAGMSKWSEAQQTIETWKTNLQDQLQPIFDNTGALQRYINKLGINQKKWQSMLSNVSRFKTGSFRLQETGFEISSLPLHGIALEIRRHGYYAAINFGKEGKQVNQVPAYARNLTLTNGDRKVFQIKTGIGMPEKSHLHLVYTSIKSSAVNSSTFATFPKHNILFSIKSKYQISETFFVEGQAAVSNADFTGKADAKELLQNIYNDSVYGSSNLASLVRFGWRNKNGRSEYSVSYRSVGSNFVSLGNPFLLANRNILTWEGRQKLLRNRGEIKIAYSKGITNNPEGISPHIRQDRFSGQFTYLLNKKGSKAWASYSPNYYLQSAPGTSATLYQLNLTTIGMQNMVKKTKNEQWINLFQLTNYVDLSKYGDTSVIAGLWYGLLTQSYVTPKYSVSVSGNAGLGKAAVSEIHDFNIDVNQSFSRKNLQFSQGMQLIKRFYGKGMLLGNSGGMQLSFKKTIKVSLNGTYYIGLTNDEKNQFYISSSASCQF